MKITFSREEVQEIILAHANSITNEIVAFNTLESELYMSIPEISVWYEAPEKQEVAECSST